MILIQATEVSPNQPGIMHEALKYNFFYVRMFTYVLDFK